MWWALSCQCGICVNPTSNVTNGWSVHLSIVGKSVSHSMDWSRGGSSFWASSHLICLFWARSHLIAGSASPQSAPIWKLTTLVSWCLIFSVTVVKSMVGVTGCQIMCTAIWEKGCSEANLKWLLQRRLFECGLDSSVRQGGMLDSGEGMASRREEPHSHLLVHVYTFQQQSAKRPVIF